jgi:hypothetical protein
MKGAFKMGKLKILLIEPKKDIRIAEVTQEEFEDLRRQVEDRDRLNYLSIEDGQVISNADNIHDVVRVFEGVTKEDLFYLRTVTTDTDFSFQTHMFYTMMLGCNEKGEVLLHHRDRATGKDVVTAAEKYDNEGDKNDDYVEFNEETMKVIKFDDKHHLMEGVSFIALAHLIGNDLIFVDMPMSFLNHYMERLKSVRN